MSYARRNALHGLVSGAYPAGTQVAAGFQTVGMPAGDDDRAAGKLRLAVTTAFPMGTIMPPVDGRPSIGWGPAYGVPSGRLYAVVTTNREGVTGDEINSAWIAVAQDLRTRLGYQINLTHAHTLGGAAPLPSLTPTASFLTAGVAGLVAIPLIGGIAYLLMRRRKIARNRRRAR